MPPILNFKQLRPATECGYINAYVSIPAFSYVGPIWKGASEVVCQFNYSATRNFVLRDRPTMPTGANYVACIKYRIGYTVYRYKLWEGIDEVMPNLPLYRGQIIKKNFVIEIWNIASSNAVSGAIMTLELGSRKIPENNYSSLANYEDGDAGILVSPSEMISNSAALPTQGLLAQYTAEGWTAGALTLEDQYGAYDLAQTGLVEGGSYVNPNSSTAQFPAMLFQTAADFYSGASPVSGLGTKAYIVALMSQHAWSANEILMGTIPEGIDAVQLVQRTSSPNLSIKTGVGTYAAGTFSIDSALGTWGVAVVEINPATISYAGLGSNRQISRAMTGFLHPASLRLGGYGLLLSDVLIYGDDADATIIEQASEYLLNLRGFTDVIPTEPDGDIAWEDNAP